MLHSLVIASEKFKEVKTWEEVIKPLRNPFSVDNRTDKEIEEYITNKYNEIFGIE